MGNCQLYLYIKPCSSLTFLTELLNVAETSALKETCRYEKRMTKGKELEVPDDSETVKSFLHRSNPFWQLYYSVFHEEVGNMVRHYTLLIADIPYGFRITGSMYDDVPYKYTQIEKMVKDFAELILAPLWRIVIFHSMGHLLSVATALKSRCHSYS